MVHSILQLGVPKRKSNLTHPIDTYRHVSRGIDDHIIQIYLTIPFQAKCPVGKSKVDFAAVNLMRL